jgi:hypothetical protein
VKICYDRGEAKITGKKVADILGKKEATITEGIKYHKTNIIALMEREPSQWTLLRNHFRPIINVLESRK